MHSQHENFLWRYLAIIAVGAALLICVRLKYVSDIEAAMESYRVESHEMAMGFGMRIEHVFERIYDGLRTIARLPGVRAIDRYAEDFDTDARETTQEIYNSLATAVAMSEVYIVSVDMQPSEWDLKTGWMQAPITTFDGLILGKSARDEELNAAAGNDGESSNSELRISKSWGDKDDVAVGSGDNCFRCHAEFDSNKPPKHIVPVIGEAEEIEYYEYELMVKQMAWMKQNCPREEDVSALTYPLISGPEVITCDNRRYDIAHPNNSDRSGLVLSVPLFDPRGDLRGCVSGVILTNVLRDLLPGGQLGLVNTHNHYVARSWDDGPVEWNRPGVSSGTPSQDLIYSEVLDLPVDDESGQWQLWVGRPDSEFWDRMDVRSASTVASVGYVAIGLLTAGGGLAVGLGIRHHRELRRINLRLEKRVDERTAALQKAARTLEENNDELEVRQYEMETQQKELFALNSRLEASADEMKRTLDELKAYKFALDEHSIVTTTDLAGRIDYANDKFCKISKYSREELIGQTHRIVNSGKHSREFWAGAWNTAVRGGIWREEVCNRAKDGSLYWTDATIAGLRGAEGKINKFIAIRTDITERKLMEDRLIRAQEAAESANKSKSEFLANMSHEIRTPMTAILGFAELLLDEGDLARAPERRVNAIRTIQRNGDHLLGVINDILDISKIEAGKLTVERKRCSPCQVLAEVASLMQVRADDRMIQFRIDPDGPLPVSIESDELRLRQILINLVGNAIKFTEHGSVRLIPRFVRGPVPMLQFDVVDTGIGMTDEQVTRLFTPFSQADTSMARRFGGTGLGLTISRRLSEMLGGGIEIIATAPGEGTTMRATVSPGSLDGVEMIEDVSRAISESVDASATHDESQSMVGATDPLAGLKILLAEDGPDNQRLISLMLKKAGATVDIAENGKAAVEAAWRAVESSAFYDIILMDMQMPIMDGYEATAQLRANGYRRPIVALTAHAMGGEMKKCISAGCDGYLTKPIKRSTLIEGVLQHALATAPSGDAGEDRL